jgi:hypothetical protein
MAGQKPKPGDAWKWNKSTNDWARPKKPVKKGVVYRWDDDKGWVSKEQQATDYGLALSVINSDKTLRSLFDAAWQDELDGRGWDEVKFKNALKGTDWFKKRSSAQQEFYTLQKDPARKAEYEARIKQNIAGVQNVAKQLGSTLTDAQYRSLAIENLSNGWSESQLQNAVSKYVSYASGDSTPSGSLTGTAGSAEDQLRDYANKMGIDVTDQWILTQARSATGSGGNIDAGKDWIKERAKEKYAAYADDLSKSETTIEDLSYNYRTTMASLLELNPEELTMNDPTIKNVMMSGDGTGNKKNLFDFEKSLRSDPRWGKTKNAKESSNKVVNNILSTFGLA